jgi:hypothetical protein
LFFNLEFNFLDLFQVSCGGWWSDLMGAELWRCARGSISLLLSPINLVFGEEKDDTGANFAIHYLQYGHVADAKGQE